ncbi:alpha/beta fold hydrolase [Caballeronia humi]|uniref:Alpha/beta hydrolase n=1 Tax=Caballeronia humi TaxID=326474 RepID=A0A158F0I7_9BURK|nr:alpha/beta hydrolase [Caballeronia humi]SAL13347.1 alpha/beta hydrolase [Caballeronia humi]
MSTRKAVDTSAGTVEYRESGTGRPVLYVHGIFTNSHIWDPVVEKLPDGLRHIQPDFPFGAQHVPAREDADLSPTGLAAILLDVIEALDLKDVTIVANDTGGAVTQIAATGDDPRAARIGRLVLTNCDAFEEYPPPAFKTVQDAAKADPVALAAQSQTPEGRAAFLATAAKTRLPDSELLEILGGGVTNPEVARDGLKVLLAMAPHYTLDAAKNFSKYQKPVSLVWGENCIFFPPALGVRLKESFPNARLKSVPNAMLLVSIDQPQAVADAIVEATHA